MKSKHLLLTLLLALLVPWAAMAQTPSVTIGSGTATLQSLPSDSYYKYAIAQQIYTAEEIDASGNITSIAFYNAGSGTATHNHRKFKIYMAHTDKDKFTSATDWIALTEANLVYEAPSAVTFTSNTWTTLTLDTPFAYNGTDNLVVAVIDNTGGYVNSSHNLWRVFTTTDNQSLYKCGDALSSLTPNGYNGTAQQSGTFSTSKNQIVLGGIQQSCAEPSNLTATLDDTDHTIATLSWTENGQATSWVLQYSEDNTFATGVQSFNISGTPSKDLTGLTPEHKYYARVRPSCSETKWSEVCTFKPTAAIPQTVCDGTAPGTTTTTNSYVPVFGNYAENYNKDEFIIPATTQGMSNMDGGTISQMTFYLSSPASALWGNARYMVFLKEVNESSFASTSYYGTEGATIVLENAELDGTHETMTIEFTTDYVYNGGNLLVGIYETTKGTYKSAYFYGIESTSGALYKNNSTSLESITSGNLQNFIPKTTFTYVPNPTPKPKNLQVTNLAPTSATLSWEAPTTATPTGYGYQYKQSSVTDWPTNWTNIEYLNVALSLNPYTNYDFRVRANYTEGFSNPVEISFKTLASCAIPTNFVATTTPGQGTKATLTWVRGYDEEAWVLEYGTDPEFGAGTYTAVTDGFIINGNNVTCNLATLTPETHYYARVQSDCGGDVYSQFCFTDFTVTNYVDYTFGETPYSTVSSVPFYGSYANYGTLSQFIIPAAQLADVAGGTIRRLTFYSSTATASWGDAVFEVYVKEVEASSFASANAEGLEDWTTMTNVYSGSLSVSNSQMVIELDNSFTYNGGNLMIGFNETTKGTSSSVSWRYVQGPSNSALYAYKTSSSGSLNYYRNIYLPRITFNYQPTATPRPIITVPVTATDVTATIAWTKPSDNVTGYKYQYKLASATEWPTSWTELNDANAVSVTVPNLTPNTSYDFQIKAVYAEGESAASSTSFATTCPAATAVPYTYDFETAPKFNCWTVISGNITRKSGSAHASSSYRLDFRGTVSNMIALPAFAEATNTLRIEFWTRPESSSAPNENNNFSGKFAVGYMTDIADANTFVAIATYNNTDWASSPTYTKKVVDFDGTGVPANAIIAMRQFDCATNYYWYVDDVKVKVIPTCEDVNDVHYVSFTNHSATIAWTADAAQAAWQIAYKAGANFDPYNAEELATATIVDVTSNPYLFDKNLEAATTYYMYVRGNCGDVDGLGDWSDSYATFTTKAAAPAPSNFTASNFGKRTVDLVWTAGGGDYETSWELYYVASATDPTAPDNETEANKTVNTLPTTEEPYTLGGLTPETRYYIWVRANHGTTDGKSAWTALTGGYFTTDVACHAPTNVAASSITNNSAEISWEGDANGYNIRYREYVVPTETLYDFENGMGEWTTIDADNDGFNWVLGSQAEVYLYEGNLSGNGYNGSSDLIASGSYRNTSSSGEELYPDNYLVSPMVTLGGTISFYACGTDDDYYAEHFGVFVSTNSNNDPNDFVMVNEWTATSTSYTQYTADLSAYSGQGYVAIRHFNCSNQFVLCVDNITIADPVTEQPWTLIENVTSPQPIPGLTAETTYEVQVQAVCGGEDGESVWTSLAEPFTTLSNCSAPGELNATDITSTSATLSWTGAQDKYNVRYSKLVAGPEVTISEDFESYEANNYSATSGDRPSDWAYSTGNTSGYFTPQVSNNDLLAPSYYGISGMSGQGNILYMLGAHNYAVMPRIENLTSFTFKYAFENASNGTFKVGYVTDASNISGSFNQFENVTTSGTTTLTTVTLTSTELDILNSTDGARLAFNFNYSSSYGFAIDDISYTTQSFTPEAWNEDNVNVTSPLPINGLEMGTSYVWEVQGINAGCGDEGLTEWSALANFATPYPSFTREITGYGENAGGYVLIASPLAGETDPANVTNMIPTVAANYDLYYFDQAQDLEWINYKDTENGGYNLINGKGYLYANKNTVTLTFTGAPGTNGTVTLNLTSGVEFEGLNLVGNPFGVQAYISKPYYRMEEGGAEIMSTSSSDAINVMEGVFVIADTDGEELTFSTTAPDLSNSANLNLNLSQANRVIDRAIVSFGKGEQLPKFQLNKSNTKVYIPVEGKDYAIANAESNVGEIPVSFEAKNNGTYTLSFTNEEVSFAYLHLIDNMTGIETDLLANPSYTFEARTTDYASRFKLVFATGSSTGSDTFAYYSNGNWVINNEGRATLQVVDVNGRILKSESINGCANVNFKAAAGIYMIRLVNGDNVKVQKVVVR